MLDVEFVADYKMEISDFSYDFLTKFEKGEWKKLKVRIIFHVIKIEGRSF